jgi:gluconolactonase
VDEEHHGRHERRHGQARAAGAAGAGRRKRGRGLAHLVPWLGLVVIGCGRPDDGIVLEQELAGIVPEGARPKKLVGGLELTEGPVWMGGRLVFSDLRLDRLMTWSPGAGLATLREGGVPNGNALDRAGRLVTCRHGARDVVRTELGGGLTVLAARHAGGRLNSPNDLAVAADGAIWFTDPPFGLKGRAAEQAGSFVYRLEPRPPAVSGASSEPRAVITDLDRPNGICFSPDGGVLYVAESGRAPGVWAWDVGEGGALSGRRRFASTPAAVPDGMCCDEDGRLYCATTAGLRIYLPDGRLAAALQIGEEPRNAAFGGAEGRTLFVTAGGSVYALELGVRGARAPN